MSELSESQIREYAKSCDLEKLHQQYQYTSKNSPELIDHNGYYHNFIFFRRNNFLQQNKIDSIPLNDNFEEVFINELFSIEQNNQFKGFYKQCAEYDAVTSKINQSNINELWKKFGEVMNHTSRIIEDKSQQELIKNFHNLYADTSQGKKFLIPTDQTAFRLYLMDENPISLQFYRTYLHICKLEGIYKPDKRLSKEAFYKFNVWLDKFFKDNKLEHRLDDKEKEFYLYLLKETNRITDTFPTYFQGEINLDWWGQDMDRSKSLKQSRAYLNEGVLK